METAVVCSCRNRPQDSKDQCEPTPKERRSEAAATKRNSSWAPVSSSGAKPSSSTMINSLTQQCVNDLGNAVVGEAAVEGVDQVGGA